MRKSLSFSCFSSLGGVHKASAQLDKHYFFYVGRSYIIDNKFRDAIETLNVLLKVMRRLTRAISCAASPNTTETCSGRNRFSYAIENNPFLRPRTSTGRSPVRGWVITTMR